MISLTKLIEHCQSQVSYNETTLAKWKASFEKDAAYAFSWSSNAILAAANADVAKKILAWIDGWNAKKVASEFVDSANADALVESIHHETREMVLRKARWPERSTSVVSNECSLAEMAAWTELMLKIEGKL